MDELDTNLEPEATTGSEGTDAGVPEVDPFHPQGQTDTTQAPDAATTQGEDTFLTGSDLDPRKLPPEMQPIFKRMQGVYTKKFQDLASLKEKAETVDRFYGDRAFAQETLVGWAAQNGYQLVPLNGAQAQQQAGPAQQQPGQQGQAPAQLIEAFKQNLAPELQWMAEPMAAAMGKSMQHLLAPVMQQQEQAQQGQRMAEWERYADDLRGVAPGWEEHEEVMTELHEFLTSPQMNHPKYGSKIEMLYNLATNKAAAMKTATDRVNAAAKNRVSSGRSGATRVPGIGDQVAKAKTNNDAWELAKKHALEQRDQRGST